MLVWVASFPRSGNTFLRIVLSRRYGVRTSVIYDFDGVADRVGGELIGYVDRPAALAEMRAAAEPHFIKTHRPRDADVGPDDRAICLVRDGRDALVSWARLRSAEDPDGFPAMLRRLIEDGGGSWGTNVLSWLQPPAPQRVRLSYADLVADPAAAVDPVMALVAPGLRADPTAAIPTFDELRRVDTGFFRRGTVGSHRDELPPELHELFRSRPENRAALELLGLA